MVRWVRLSVRRSVSRLFGWLDSSLFDVLGWLNGELVGVLVYKLIGGGVSLLVVWLVGQFVGCSMGRVVVWSVCEMVGHWFLCRYFG